MLYFLVLEANIESYSKHSKGALASYNLLLKALGSLCFCISKVFLKKFEIFLFFLLKINIFLVFLDHFDALISKIIF